MGLDGGLRVSRLRTNAARWALAADTHLAADAEARYGDASPDRNLDHALSQWRQARTQAALLNGDLSWAVGAAGDYARLAAKLDRVSALGPLILTPGNHDNRRRMLQRFAVGYSADNVEKALTIVDGPAFRLVVLDSLYRTDIVAGLLGERQRRRLVETLDREDRRPTILIVHHPLNPTDDALLDSDRLLSVLQPRAQVKAIFTAHDHVYRGERRAALHIVKLPAVGMPFDPKNAVGWVEASFDSRGADLRLWSAQGPADTQRLDWRC